MKHTDSQRQRLKDYLDKGQSINPLQAFNQIGTMKLSTRVSELIDEGYPISKEWVTVQNRFGEDVRVMKYSKLSCEYVKRHGESCTLNNNCRYPNC